MLNWIFLALIASAVLTAGLTGKMLDVTQASLASAKSAVELAIGLIGQMTLWLGFMGVLREAGLMRGLAQVMRPVMTRLFPDVPADHPAMSAMIMNIAANVLGLGNAATPFGLKAMKELDAINPHRGVATNAMALFLAINTSGVAVLPLGVVAVRAALGAKDPAGIIVPSIIGTVLSSIIAVLVCKALERLPNFAPERSADAQNEDSSATPSGIDVAQAEAIAAAQPSPRPLQAAIAVAIALAVVGAMVRTVITAPATQSGVDLARVLMSDWLLPVLMLTIVLLGFGRGVKVYEAFIPAAKEGFQVAVTIIPFMVAILVAIGMFRASGAMDAISQAVGPFTQPVGFPPEALPMALIRPLSGNGALAVMSELLKTHGPDSFLGYLVSLLNGSSETTFYVLALYFGTVGVRAVRHTLAVCLVSDVCGVIITTALCHAFFG